jgi:hypothetical protein
MSADNTLIDSPETFYFVDNEAHNGRAALFFMQGKYKEAVDDFTCVIERNAYTKRQEPVPEILGNDDYVYLTALADEARKYSETKHLLPPAFGLFYCP